MKHSYVKLLIARTRYNKHPFFCKMETSEVLCLMKFYELNLLRQRLHKNIIIYKVILGAF